MKDVIVKERELSHNIQQVWKAISEAAEISAWFIKADFKAEKGYKYSFTHTDESTGNCTNINGEVLEVTPVNRLVYTWIVSGTNVETTVAWNLQETENGTKILLEHSGISNYPAENAVNMFNSFSGGWESCYNELDKYLSEMHAEQH